MRKILVAIALLCYSASKAETQVTWILQKGAEHVHEMKYWYGQGEGADNLPGFFPDAPNENWYKEDYDDSSWGSKKVPFGSDLSGDQKWEGEYNCYWLRESVNLDKYDETATYYFVSRHDDTYKVYINGELVADRNGWSGGGYCYFPVELKQGRNVIAVYIEQNWGGSYFDCVLHSVGVRLSVRFKGEEPSEGDFYLYNPASGLWLENNNRIHTEWTTRAELGIRGIDFQLKTYYSYEPTYSDRRYRESGEGAYFLYGKFCQGTDWYGNPNVCSIQAGNRYLDTEAIDAWHFERVKVPGLTNAYKVTYWPTDADDFTLSGVKREEPNKSKNLLAAESDVYLDCLRDGINDYCIWVLVSKEQRLAMLATATDAEPQDATWLIKNPDFADVDTRSSAWHQENSQWIWANGDNMDGLSYKNIRVGESYRTENVELSQTVDDLPAGKYRLRVQGYYRFGEAYFFAGIYQKLLPSYSESNPLWVEQDRMRQGAYISEALDFNHSGGSLILGIRKGDKKTDLDDWIVISEFRLEYLGNDGAEDFSDILPYGGQYYQQSYLNLFDKNPDTYWSVNPDPNSEEYDANNGNVLFKSPEPVYVKGLTLTTSDDTFHNPYEWYLYGTNDENIANNIYGSEWEEIASNTKADLPNEGHTDKYYGFNPRQTAYRYFKFRISFPAEMPDNSRYLYLAELSLDCSTTPQTMPSILADGGYSFSGEGAANLFDGNSKTKWCKVNDDYTNWVVLKMATPIYATSYSIQTANDFPVRDPKKFQLYGASGDFAPSADGTTDGWTLLDSQSDASVAVPTERGAMAMFGITPGIYQYFMFKVDETRGVADAFQMSELSIHESPDNMAIFTDRQMADFVAKVNSGKTKLNALLFDDVNSSVPFGTQKNAYKGTFDGKGHKVNLSIDVDADRQAFIGVATGGAVVRNLTLTGHVKNSGEKTAGFIAEVSGGGLVSIDNCVNEARVEGNSGETAAFVGNNDFTNSCVLDIRNAYNLGDVSGAENVASICASLATNTSSFTNIYNAGNVTGAKRGYFVLSRAGTFNNCYSTTVSNADNSNVTLVTDEQIQSGEVCYLLNGDQSEICFYQEIGSDKYPTLDSTKPRVYELSVGEAGYSTFVPTENVSNIPVGVTAYAVQDCGSYLHLEPVTELPADNAVVLKAEGGNYYYNITDAERVLGVANDLIFSEEPVSTDGTQYILAQPSTGVVGFYRAGGMIPARKGYFQSRQAGIKVFCISDDDATGVERIADDADALIYNLSGQRLKHVQKGVNIVGDRVVMY